MFSFQKLQYRLERKAQRKTGTPFGTIAYYGPDSSRASKVVVGIFNDQEDLKVMKKWFSQETDIRTEAKILSEILDFLDENQVQRIVLMDQIIGCPHEEGIDYPEGEKCPQCSYWANRNRWTGEIEE